MNHFGRRIRTKINDDDGCAQIFFWPPKFVGVGREQQTDTEVVLNKLHNICQAEYFCLTPSHTQTHKINTSRKYFLNTLQIMQLLK